MAAMASIHAVPNTGPVSLSLWVGLSGIRGRPRLSKLLLAPSSSQAPGPGGISSRSL
ncbi:hypothetical protein LZ32DRAFT_611921 [Colletotrichum eremochloae]|nr:hypothetical protein LZ32DRAFT_611921 [Colletotrichum eremochloae]